ncbi:hypothetical protein DIPPA_10527 [Diplonema papillatum]|nr:hypothetical protein DIPPA_10527 [Diplonema papillatum]
MCDGRKVWLNGAPPAMSATEATGDKPLHRLVPPAWRLDDARHYALSRSAAPRATPPYMRARQTPPRHLRSPYSDSPMGLTPSEPASPPATATPTRGSTPARPPRRQPEVWRGRFSQRREIKPEATDPVCRIPLPPYLLCSVGPMPTA